MSKPPSIVMFHINKMYSMSLREAEQYLRKNGFFNLGSGCESEVFTRDGFEYVIKLCHSPHRDTAFEYIQNSPNHNFFIPCWAFEGFNFFIAIQKKIEVAKLSWYDKPYQKFIKKVKKMFPSISDTCEFNIGIDRGTLKCFDWVDNNYHG